MGNAKCTAMIVITGSKVDVDFDGDWTKRLCDVAYGSMLRELPKYILETRAKEEKESLNDSSK